MAKSENSNEHSAESSASLPDLEPKATDSTLKVTREELGNAINREAPLSIYEIAKVRSEVKQGRSYKAREYAVNGTSVSILRPPVLDEQIRNEEHKQKILSVLRHREEGEAECYERLLVNILREQERIAKKFSLPEEGLYLSMKLNYIVDSNVMMGNLGDIYMQTLARHVDDLKKQGASDEDIVTELAGHIFHEAVHQGEGGLGEALHPGKFSFGEVTTITAQLAYYLEKGYKGPKAYDSRRLQQGLQKIKDGQQSSNDHDIATCASAELLLKNLSETFPDISKNIEGSSGLDACEEIVFQIPAEKRADLIPCLKRAIIESADKEVFAKMVEQLRS